MSMRSTLTEGSMSEDVVFASKRWAEMIEKELDAGA
jgi:hypothetical protein